MAKKIIVVGDDGDPLTAAKFIEQWKDMCKAPERNITRDQFGYITPQQRVEIDKIIEAEGLKYKPRSNGHSLSSINRTGYCSTDPFSSENVMQITNTQLPFESLKDEYISDDERENFGAVNSNVSAKKLAKKKAKSKAAKKARKKNRKNRK